ncbi:MAG: UvrD-helicase domain-containing protein [Pseudomonadota bacterium]|nr:hypothetical protein [Gammaproteobacteria bacterium]MEE2683904.1 UvrD-helicase domain-containing protein [Pseudomonadota bacterium]|tara:strand:+ start:67 stop:2760 length:2694 start_codon:yes stop_codon:yes gene_type:complete
MNDLSQRREALDIKKSFIIQAPAGSGKTELLIQRYLSLLLEVSVPEQVLAVTFTRKASFEMKDRVIEALNNVKTDNPPKEDFKIHTYNLAKSVLKKSVKNSWNIDIQSHRLRIETIDAVSSSIANDMPILSGGISRYQRTDNPKKYYLLAVKNFIQRASKDSKLSNALKKILIHIDGNYTQLNELLSDMLSTRDQWLPYLSSDNFLNKNYVEDSISDLIESCLLEIKNNISIELLEIIPTIARLISKKIGDKYSLESWKNSDGKIPVSKEYLNDWKFISYLLITDNNSWRKNIPSSFNLSKDDATKKILISEISKIKNNQYLNLLLVKLKNLPDYRYDIDQWDTLKLLRLILINLVAELKVVFNKNRITDFIEVNLSASEALGSVDNPSDLLLALDHSISHILIDEFHDTSFTQFKLIKALISGWQENDGRTIFLVGDPMQSIYGFRDADISIFNSVKYNGIGDIKVHPLFLCNNFRSSNSIVNWLNIKFSNLFKNNMDILLDSPQFSPSISRKNSTNSDTFIKSYTLNDENKLNESIKVIDILKKELERDPNQNIGILVRSRNHLLGLHRLLKLNKIDVNALEIDPLKNSLVVQDLIGLTRGMLHLGDRAAWLSILRSPWCGITWSDLVALLENKDDMTVVQILNLKDKFDEISDDGNERLMRLRNILHKSNGYRADSSLTEWIKRTWLDLKGPYLLGSDDQLVYVEKFFEILGSIEDRGDLEDPILLGSHFDMYIPNDNKQSTNINIMTIHKSKGLEFDTVILLGLGKTSPTEKNKLIDWLEYKNNDHKNLIFSPIHQIRNENDYLPKFINIIKNKNRDLERIRLFYVATSRARERLYLVASIKAGNKKPNPRSFLSFYWDDKNFNSDKLSVNLSNDSIKNNLIKIPLLRYKAEQ